MTSTDTLQRNASAHDRYPLPALPDDKLAIEVCEAFNVRLVEAQEEETKGMWDWLDDQGNACEMSFPTDGDAARNAIKTLGLPF